MLLYLDIVCWLAWKCVKSAIQETFDGETKK